MKYVINDGEGVEEEQNAYSQYGLFCHELIDKWAKGEAKAEQLLQLYQAGYSDAVTLKFPKISKNADETYYLAGYDYFAKFKGIVPGAAIVESEKKHVIDLFGVDFSGILDMVLTLPDGREAIVDHKSSSMSQFTGKKLDEKYRQLYLYAEIRKRLSGKFPDVLIFNLFREARVIERPFDRSEYEESMAWAHEIIDDIAYMYNNFSNQEFEWPTKQSFFYCSNLCDVTADCIL